MYSLSHCLLVLVLPLLTIFEADRDFEKTISRAMARAATEQRQLMLYFTEKGCAPCRETDAFFAEQNIQQAIDSRYVSARVDVADFDGQACREIYGVDEVPAVIIVKPDGAIVVKKERGLTTGDIESLALHGYIPEMDAPERSEVGENPANPSPQNIDRAPTADAIGTADGPFALQLGFFSNKENAENLTKEIRQKGFEDARVNPEIRDDKTFYRVLVGSYGSSDIAETDKRTLEGSGFNVKVHKNGR